jgi:adenylate kinase
MRSNVNVNVKQVEQAILFEKAVSPCWLVLHLEVDDKELIERLLQRGKTSGRVDDNEQTIRTRLSTFHKHSQPILQHYRDKVKRVQGQRPADQIFAELCGYIDSSISAGKPKL